MPELPKEKVRFATLKKSYIPNIDSRSWERQNFAARI
jgi:hypothetical protein